MEWWRPCDGAAASAAVCAGFRCWPAKGISGARQWHGHLHKRASAEEADRRATTVRPLAEGILDAAALPPARCSLSPSGFQETDIC